MNQTVVVSGLRGGLELMGNKVLKVWMLIVQDRCKCDVVLKGKVVM